MEAARDIQSDVLSVLKRISRYTVDTQPHLLWYQEDHDVLFRYDQLNKFRRQCERAMESCFDGQKVAPRNVPKYAYFNHIFDHPNGKPGEHLHSDLAVMSTPDNKGNT
jgi:hypothetical protein